LQKLETVGIVAITDINDGLTLSEIDPDRILHYLSIRAQCAEKHSYQHNASHFPLFYFPFLNSFLLVKSKISLL